MVSFYYTNNARAFCVMCEQLNMDHHFLVINLKQLWNSSRINDKSGMFVSFGHNRIAIVSEQMSSESVILSKCAAHTVHIRHLNGITSCFSERQFEVNSSKNIAPMTK